MEYNPIAHSSDLHHVFQDAEAYTRKALMDIWMATSKERVSEVARRAVDELQQLRIERINTKLDLFSPLLIAADHIISRAAAEKGK